jgi:type II secretory ATPase GspE/PulE/Tfp pilus assembly ATPase PilB-like protein
VEWVRTIDELGFPPAARDAYRRCLHAERGLLIVGGMRESGMSTTMYAGILELKATRAACKVVTIEDPIDAPIEGMTQLEVKASRGFWFTDGIAAARELDADVIVVGGLRDRESIERALEAARSCLVIAGLYCSRPDDARASFVEYGAAAADVDAVLLGTFVQELVVSVEYLVRDAPPR